jgi:hypothetical protein
MPYLSTTFTIRLITMIPASITASCSFRGPDKPVSRVLYPSITGRTVTIYLALPLPEGSSDLPQGCNEAGRPLPCYSVLHRMGFARHRCHHRSGELLPRHFTLILPRTEGRYVSVALSVCTGFHRRTLGVTQHPARRSSDFPHPSRQAGRTRSPGLSDPHEVYYRGIS